MTDAYLLPHAALDWEEGAPVSRDYGDIYWHKDAAIDEKTAVFVNPAREMADENSPFTITELGFGFGINCLLTAENWPERSSLNFVSIEKHPVTKEDLQTLLSPFNFRFAETLLDQYPPAYRGQHVIWLSSHIRLLLIFEDVSTALANLDAEVDYWFLDGFSPASNEDMWANALYRKMFARSRQGARVATYSAAGIVRHGLSNAGFQVEKIPGFGRKREMLRATRPGNWQPAVQRSGDVIIIGAGLAGRYCAEALSRRNVPFKLIDSGDAGPSSIPQLAVFPQLALAPETRYRFSLAASQYMLGTSGFYQTGLCWFGRTPDEQERLIGVADMFPDNIIEAQDDGSVLFHSAGWLAPNALPAESITRETVTSLTRVSDRWHCETASGDKLIADTVILATGFNRNLLPEELQVRAIRGQAISIETQGITEVLNGNATVFPTWQGRSVISGTYARSSDMHPSDEDTASLLALARPLTDSIAQSIAQYGASAVQTMVGIRAVSRDRLPIVGQAPDWHLLEDANQISAINCFEQGLHFCTAFGSRGATHARLCAEHLVNKIQGEPAALGIREQEMLSPARYVMRDRNN